MAQTAPPQQPASAPAPAPAPAPGAPAANPAAPAAGVPAPFANASLYVGELSPDVTEANLFEVFNSVGPVASIRVCRDTVTRRSLGYAYVNYHNVADAERALENINYQPIRGQACRIMWSHRDPSIRRSGVGNIFIKNLDKDIDNKALFDTFSAFGNILSCKVECDENGNSKGFGYVHYETGEAAQLAIEKVNGMSLNGKVVYVGLFQPRRERGSTYEQKFNNVFVKNLDPAISEDELRKAFAEYGEILSCVIMFSGDGEERVSRGFGFISFASPEDAKRAVEEKNDTLLGAKKIFCGRAQKKSEREAELRSKFEALKIERQSKYQGSNLYIKNLDDTISDDRLREEFAPFGTISSAKVMCDDKGTSRGFGFVCYSSPDEATKAVTEMNGKLIGNKPIYVALHQRKELRRAQLEAQHAARGMRMQRMDPGMSTGPALYPPGAPVFYQNMGPPGVQRGQAPPVVPATGFVYPQQLMGGRAGWRPGPQAPQGRGGYMPPGVGAYPPPQQMGATRPPQQRGGVPPQGGPAGVNGNRPQVPGGRQGGQRGFKYNPNGRNNRDMQGQGQMAQGPAQDSDSLTTSVLAAASPAEQKQMLGERLFPLIQSHNEPLAGKITGMLLEMDNSELLILLESPEALAAKVQEAVVVLNAHARQQGDAPAEGEAAESS